MAQPLRFITHSADFPAPFGPQRIPGIGIPNELSVFLGTSLGPIYGGTLTALDDMFGTKTYSVAVTDPTVDALKGFSALAVLYLNAHGAILPLKSGGAPTYTLWTSTIRARDGSTDQKYLADLQDGSLT